MLLQIVRTLGNSSATECVSLIAQHTREDGEGEPPAMWREAGFRCDYRPKGLFCLPCGTCRSVFRVRRKDVWDASCGIGDVCSGLHLVIHALRDQIKDIRIQ